MFFPNDCYVRHPSLRMRPVPEQNCCIVFTAQRPNLYTLNPTAWLVLELCDGQPGTAIEAAYREAVEAPEGDDGAAAALREIVVDFEGKGIVERHPPQQPGANDEQA